MLKSRDAGALPVLEKTIADLAAPIAAAADDRVNSEAGHREALRQILTGPDEPDEAKLIARRRRFVMASVLGFLGVNFVMFLRFFLPRALYEPHGVVK